LCAIAQRGVEREKSLLGHVDFAAHLADIRYVAPLELFRHVLEGADVGGDVFALGAIATRGCGDEFASLISQRHREPVDLRLGAEIDRFAFSQLEEAADTADEIQHILLGKSVVERQHRHCMPDLLEFPRRRRTDSLGRRFAAHQFRKPGFDRVQSLAKRVVFGIGNFRRIVLIVSLVMAFDLERQALVLDPGLRLGEGVDSDRRLL
jgi:hypothetical protein